MPCVVVTDRACEPGSGDQVVCTVGGVMFVPMMEVSSEPLVLMFRTVLSTLGKMLQGFVQLLKQRCMQNALQGSRGLAVSTGESVSFS